MTTSESINIVSKLQGRIRDLDLHLWLNRLLYLGFAMISSTMWIGLVEGAKPQIEDTAYIGLMLVIFLILGAIDYRYGGKLIQSIRHETQMEVEYEEKAPKLSPDWFKPKPPQPQRAFTPPPKADFFPVLAIDEIQKYPEGHYVYIIQDIDITGYVKIGRTNNPYRRLHRFETIMPVELGVIHIIPCQNEVQAESELHRYYAMKRKRGEWFQLDKADIAHLLSIKGM